MTFTLKLISFIFPAMQRNTRVRPPPKSTVYEPLPLKPTLFRKCYKRGEFPIAIEFTNAGRTLAWKVTESVTASGNYNWGLPSDEDNSTVGTGCLFYRNNCETMSEVSGGLKPDTKVAYTNLFIEPLRTSYWRWRYTSNVPFRLSYFTQLMSFKMSTWPVFWAFGSLALAINCLQ